MTVLQKNKQITGYCIALLIALTILLNHHLEASATTRLSNAQERHIYTIGNSLTWDTRPDQLDENVDYHVDCGKTLQYIFDNPNDPCIGSSYVWPNALTNETYDIVTVQPYLGTTLAQDSAIISYWMQLQPTATFVIHTGWGAHVNHERDYHASNVDDQMKHSRAYFDDLTAALHVLQPEHEIISTHAIDLIDRIYHDIEDGNAPFADLSDFYRDGLHMDHATGRYLMHNLMRLTLGQTMSDADFPDIAADTKTYFNRKLCEHASGGTYDGTPTQIGSDIYCTVYFLPIMIVN